MPYRSSRQRRYMHAKHPRIAKRWDRKYGGKVQPKKGGGGKGRRGKK